jgi:hypothetical protein
MTNDDTFFEKNYHVFYGLKSVATISVEPMALFGCFYTRNYGLNRNGEPLRSYDIGRVDGSFTQKNR